MLHCNSDGNVVSPTSQIRKKRLADLSKVKYQRYPEVFTPSPASFIIECVGGDDDEVFTGHSEKV